MFKTLCELFFFFFPCACLLISFGLFNLWFWGLISVSDVAKRCWLENANTFCFTQNSQRLFIWVGGGNST